MSKILMLKGLPRSGKTTWAKKFVLQSGNYVRVNRDDLRAMLHAGKWSPRNESITIDVQNAIVTTLINIHRNVIIDDTNLGKSDYDRWSNFSKRIGAEFAVKEFKSDINTLITRDNHSDPTERRGRHVIERMALLHGYFELKPQSVVLCDIDGTISDCEHRRHHVQKEPKDWKGFFSAMGDDTLRQSTFTLLKQAAAEGKTIIFLSARPENYRAVTESWLLKYDMSPIHSQRGTSVEYLTLLMRQENDTRADTIVKQQILDKFFDKEQIAHVIDDRPSVLRMWQSNGLKTIDVGKGVEF